MATVLFVVKATISKDKEAAFNRWYNDEHCPQPEYDAHFPDSERARFAYEQIFP